MLRNTDWFYIWKNEIWEKTSSLFIQQSLGLRLPLYIYMHLLTDNCKLNHYVLGLSHLIIYIRTSKLKPKPTTMECNYFFFLLKVWKWHATLVLFLLKLNSFCTKNEKNESEFEIILYLCKQNVVCVHEVQSSGLTKHLELTIVRLKSSNLV